ncbi:hypothetical protein PILCRDRAFT_821650 [Piloderma croceum F 1598]|uniref:Uncharacterized protein n=1 Tax=Piloderma croceum (strain F 1598) TaxID=765440 RepID=A0A0C3B4S4_PILCF|nr:hypothetical protein PILCRDRAFT_821650 [Piloderma croceum F 1598]
MDETNLMDDTLELHVHSPAFDKECAVYSKGIGRGPSDDSDSDYSSDHSLWEKDSSSVESPRYNVSKLEAHLYYFGIRGPKLIFRTSKDVFTAPSGPEQDPRLMWLRPVYEHQKLGKDDLWATIRFKVVQLLDQRNIQHSSVDLENEDDEDIEDIDIKVAPYGTVFTTPVTIWVEVLPDTLTGKVAFKSSNDILDLLKEHGISDVDVAYRESVARGFSGPQLFAPISDLDPLKAVIDPVTTALGLPIAGLKTLKSQGTMGFYFRVPGPKKEVVLMGTRAFTDFLISIQGHIGTLNNTVGVLEKRVTALTARSDGGGPNAEQAARELVETQRELNKTRTAIEELKKFFVKMKKQWTKLKDRVIGHVVWAPSVSVSTAPYSYTKDVCVVRLDEKKFSQNFRGNVLDLGAR